jgi:hypothetical protein
MTKKQGKINSKVVAKPHFEKKLIASLLFHVSGEPHFRTMHAPPPSNAIQMALILPIGNTKDL